MKCPACGNELQEMKVGEIKVDVCKGGCAGIWFDNWELDKVDEAHESAGIELLDLPRGENVSVRDEKRACPKCEGVTMLKHFFGAKRKVAIDECPKCAGVWLDQGELAAIRDEYPTEEERKKAAEEVFSEFDKQLDAMRAESDEKLQKVRKFAHALRFICPSYYIPGKQDGAAF